MVSDLRILVQHLVTPNRTYIRILVLVGLIGVFLGWATVNNQMFITYGSLCAALIALCILVLHGDTFKKAMFLMFFTLPFQSAFVLNLGMTVRLSHLFASLALVFGLYWSRIQKVPKRPALIFLWGFVFFVMVSLFKSVNMPTQTHWEVSGIRGLAVRPIVQCVQLFGMVVVMYLTIGFCSTWMRFKQAVNVIIAGGLVSLLYGFYGFGAPLFQVPYVDINNAQNTNFTYGYIEQGQSFETMYIPRPRSTFQEPLNFANFFLFAVPLSVARLVEVRGVGTRVTGFATVALALLLFLFSVSSRGAILGVLGAAVCSLLFVRRLRIFGVFLAFIVIVIVVGLVMAVGYFSIPVLIPGMDLWKALEFFWDRLTMATESGGRVSEDWLMIMPVFFDHPLLGVGFGNIPFYMDTLTGLELEGVTDTGSLYSRLLAEIGIVGTVLYAIFVISILWDLLKIGRRTGRRRDVAFYAIVVFFSIIADQVQRLSFVGIATDVHMWVRFGLGLALANLHRESIGLTAQRLQSVGQQSADAGRD